MLAIDPEKVRHVIVKQRELVEFIRSLSKNEQIELVALCWIGRGTYDAGEWEEALSEASAAHHERTAEYLVSLPALAGFLEKGLSTFGMT